MLHIYRNDMLRIGYIEQSLAPHHVYNAPKSWAFVKGINLETDRCPQNGICNVLKLLRGRLKPILKARQPWINWVSLLDVGSNLRLFVFACVVNKALTSGFERWFASLGLTRMFDCILYGSLFTALVKQNIPEEGIHLVWCTIPVLPKCDLHFLFEKVPKF